jgi:hypothetical protein
VDTRPDNLKVRNSNWRIVEQGGRQEGVSSHPAGHGRA